MIVFWWLLLVLAVVVQTAFDAWGGLRVWGVSPDFAVVLAIVIALRYGPNYGVWTGFTVGLCLDLMNPTWLGVTSLAAVIAGFISGLGVKQVLHPNRLTQWIVLIVGLSVYQSVHLLGGLWVQLDAGWMLLKIALIKWAIHCVMGSFVVFALPEAGAYERS